MTIMTITTFPAVAAIASATDSLAARHTGMHTRDIPSSRDDTAAARAPALATALNVGDLVFIRVRAKPFREVAAATGSWTNHVGIVVDTHGDEPLIGESTFPFSRFTPLSRFVARSEYQRIAAGRLSRALTHAEQNQVRVAARRRTGIFYDTGFNLFSRRQFCSRYVREVLGEATGVEVGEVQSFGDLYGQYMHNAPRSGAPLNFWKLWFFGRIPWKRKTVTPASLLCSPHVHLFFDSALSGSASGSSRLLPV